MTATLPVATELFAPQTERMPVAILGATGSVGQRFIQLLADHPWFRVHEVVASDRSAGKSYRAAADWRLESLVPDDVAGLTVKSLGGDLESKLLFSGLDSSVAGEAEDEYANRGCAVISNSKNHRMDRDVPLLIPEINADHLDAIDEQRKHRKGYIVTNPNCSVMGLAIALAPLERAFGVEAVHVTTMQAISGAGYAGVASYAILDNVIPYIGGGEEEKIETEPRKILGRWKDGRFDDAPMKISAQVNRVPTIDGHLMTVSAKLRTHAAIEDVRAAMESFPPLDLPFAPKKVIHYIDAIDRPQPRLDRDRERGMSVSVGRLRPCPILDIRFVALVHNTIRGAAGAAILNAELLKSRGLL
ncbi:MAG TPA: aspartate-semialdehyde dehydrogenase [Thermoanaerobaculia bacterium]|nr:aspartate-semialdehyde dehydrogenase [Thermoanaerobaculia bacterium]